MPSVLFPSATLAEFYRFAVLLTGSIRIAERVMAETLAEAEGQLAQFRNETARQAWLAGCIRERCLTVNTEATAPAPRLLREEDVAGSKLEILQIEAYLVAQRFHLLPEPERSALALFYLEVFTIGDISRLLKLPGEELSETLGRARALLQDQLRSWRRAPA